MPDATPIPASITVLLPNGQEKVVPVPEIETHMNVQIRTVFDGKIMAPGQALAILNAERDWWMNEAKQAWETMEKLRTEVADVKAELQHLRGADS